MTYHFRITPIFKGEIKDGKFSLPNGEFERYRKFVLSHDGPMELVLRKKFAKRSTPQNSYYWGVVIQMIAAETGEDSNVIHAFLKAKFLSREQVIAGKNKWDKTLIVGRTSKLKTDQFGYYIEKCRA